MPIISINADGTVKIARKSGADMRDVKPEELSGFSPDLARQYGEMKAQQSLMEKGVLDPSELAKTNPQLVEQSMARGFSPKTKIQKEQEESKAKALPFARDLVGGTEKLKRQARETDFGDLITNKVTGGQFGEDVDLYDTSKKLLGQTIANLYEGGRLSDKDREFYQNEVLKLSPIGRQEVIEKKLANLEEDILRKSGYKPEDFKDLRNKSEKKNDKGSLPQITTKGSIPERLIKGAGQDVADMKTMTDMTNPIGLITNPKAREQLKSAVTSGIPERVDMLKGMAQSAIAPLGGEVADGQVTFSPQRAVDNAIDNPIDTATLLMGGKGIKGGKGIEVAPLAEEAALGQRGGLPSIPGVSKAKAAMGDATKYIGRDMFANNFTIPSKLAGRINIKDVATKMNEYGHSGNMDELRAVSGKVTGQNGIFPKINREVLSQMDKPIDTSPATTVARRQLDRIAELDKKQVNKHLQIMNNVITKSESNISKANALDAFDAVKELEGLGYQYKNSSTDLTPNISSEKIGDAYIAAADELKQGMEKGAAEADLVQAAKTSENYEAIKAISPKLAEEFLQAKTIKDLRKIQAPYVRLQQAIQLTENASKTPFSQLSDQAAQTAGVAGGAMLGSLIPIPGVGTAIGAGAGLLAAPMIKSVAGQVLPRITTRMGNMMQRKPQLPPIQ